MKGIGDTIQVNDAKLNTAKSMLSEIMIAIIGQFVALQQENPFLAIEAMFRFTSSDMIK